MLETGEGAAMEPEEGREVDAVRVPVVDPLRLAWLALNDDGNAQRLLARVGGRLVHVREWGWLANDGRRWSTEDGSRLASLMAIDVARGMRDEIEALQEMKASPPDGFSADDIDERITNLRKHAVNSGNSSKTRAMLEQAATFDQFNRRMDEFDADLYALNVLNVTLRFVRDAEKAPWRVEDRPHDPNDHITRIAGARWDPKADTKGWRAHMAEVLPDDDVRWFFQKLIGYAATGLTDEQIFAMLQGKGGDGKSTTMDVIRIVLGLYAVVGNVKTFLSGQQRDAGAATPELVRFVGDTRLISIGEPKRGQAMAEEMVKAFTGGAALPARANYGDEFEFEPRGKVVMEVNSRPRISGDDDGIWRRIVIILFPRQFKKEGRIKTMKAQLLGNREGVLRWIVEGALGYLNEGLEPPEKVADAIEEYRRSANPFSEWMLSRVDTSDPTTLCYPSELYKDYKAWCEAESVGDREIMSSTAFGRALGDRQIMLGPKDSKGLKRRRGARLRAEGELYLGEDGDPADEAGSAGGGIGPQEDAPFG